MMMMLMMMMMVMVIMITIKITIKMIALKGAIRDVCSLLTTPRTVSKRYDLVAKAQSCANHVQHVDRLSRA